MADTDRPGFDPDAEADALEQLRVDLRKAGPDSGLHKISRGRAAEADALLARSRDFYRQIAANRRARLEHQQQQARQGELL